MELRPAVTTGAPRLINTTTYCVAAMASFAVISACYTNIAISVTFQRDAGVLKRTNGTPLPSAAFLGARMLQALPIAVVLVVITAALAERSTARPSLPASLVRFLIMLLVGAASFCALGFAITAAIPNADASLAIANATILPFATPVRDLHSVRKQHSLLGSVAR